MLGLPYNIASYGLLLELLAKESGLIHAKLCGMLGDVHIYENHIENAKIQLWREPSKLPNIEITNFTNIFDWAYQDFSLKNYIHNEAIKFDIAV
jgi:thymidylate synthase